jgi:ankyrin repeat protein
LYACANNAVESILILLDDARVNINCCNNSGFTALIYAVEYGFYSPIEHILASLRHIQSSDITNTIIEAKKELFSRTEYEYAKIVKLLKAYQTTI